MKRILFILTTAITFVSCESVYQISTDNVTSDITYLASDELKGRATFSPEIDKAASFIAGKFEKAGLSPLSAEAGYLQEFAMISSKVVSSSATVDGEVIVAENCTVVTGKKDLTLTQDNAKKVIIGENDDFNKEIRAAMQSEEPIIVLVHTAHATSFKRFKGYRDRAQSYFSGEEPTDMAAVLTDKQGDVIQIQASAEFTNSPLKNVVGKIEGKRSNEIVLFSAHYDHIGVRKGMVSGDSIANGANDDASGTTAVIELARYFASQPKPERTLYFVAFTAEEVGGYGSRYFSKQLNPDNIVAMFNIEMIGKPAVSGPNSAWITGFDKSDFGEILQKAVEGTEFTFYADPYPEENLFYRSDNATLARLGVPAHTISTTPIDVDKDYHQVSDEVETLNMEHMVNTIKAIAAGAKTIVDGSQTPKRVDPSTVR